jgi:outer membrane protein assembly factor BamB
MREKISLLVLSFCLVVGAQVESEQWPSHSGPNYNYQVNSKVDVPVEWSVSQQKNVLWKVQLPETGGGNVAVWGNKVFLTCFKKLSQESKKFAAAETVGYCYDAQTGKLLWQADLPGKRPNQVNCIFTDSTTPTPVTDGQHVWFVNAGGYMACYTVNGEKVWGKEFEVRTKHSAKQFQPFLHQGHIYYVSMRDKEDSKRRPQTAKDYAKNSKTGWPWMYIRRFDALTGKPAGIMEDGISVHSRGALSVLNGEVVILHAKGGGHYPPEKPFGVTLSKLANFGEKVWTIADAPMDGTHFMDDKFAYIYSSGKLKVVDIRSAQEAKTISLGQGSSVCRFNEETGKYSTDDKTFKVKKPITHRASVGFGKYQYFMSYTPGFLGRANIETGKVEYLQVPLQVSYKDGKKLYSWKKHVAMTETPNGLEVGGDKRIRGNGFGHVTAATPIVINNKIYFTTMLGTVYVLDGLAEKLGETALLSVNDLGVAGETWTLATVTAAQGKIFHRTAKELICIQAVK